MNGTARILVFLSAALLASCGLSEQARIYEDYDDVYSQSGRAVTGNNESTLASNKASLDTTMEDYYDPTYGEGSVAERSSANRYDNYYDEDDYYYSSRMRRYNSCGNYNYFNPYYSNPYYGGYANNCWNCNTWGYGNNSYYYGNSWGWGYGSNYYYGNSYYGYGNPYYGNSYYGNPYYGYGNPYYGYGNPYYGYGTPYYGYPNYGNNWGGGNEYGNNTYYGHRDGIGSGNYNNNSYSTRPRRPEENGNTSTEAAEGYNTRVMQKPVYSEASRGNFVSRPVSNSASERPVISARPVEKTDVLRTNGKPAAGMQQNTQRTNQQSANTRTNINPDRSAWSTGGGNTRTETQRSTTSPSRGGNVSQPTNRGTRTESSGNRIDNSGSRNTGTGNSGSRVGSGSSGSRSSGTGSSGSRSGGGGSSSGGSRSGGGSTRGSR